MDICKREKDGVIMMFYVIRKVMRKDKESTEIPGSI